MNGKQQAILQAFSPPEFTAYPVSKNAGAGWQCASRLCDVLAPSPSRQSRSRPRR